MIILFTLIIYECLTDCLVCWNIVECGACNGGCGMYVYISGYKINDRLKWTQLLNNFNKAV